MLKSIFLAAVAFLAVAGVSFAQPVPSRTFDLYVAPLGPSVMGIMDELNPLIAEAGRKVTDLKEIQRINAGKVTGIRFTHTAVSGAVPAKWHYQDVTVNIFGDAFRAAWEVVRFQKMASKPLVDVQIISQFGVGKVAGLRLYFAD